MPARNYTDAKSGQIVYVHHARAGRLRPATEYVYAAVHDGAQAEFGTFHTAPTGRVHLHQLRRPGHADDRQAYVPPPGVTIPNPPFVNDNLGCRRPAT